MVPSDTIPAPPPELDGVRVRVNVSRVEGVTEHRTGILVIGDPIGEPDRTCSVLFDGHVLPTFGVKSSDIELLPSALAEHDHGVTA